MDHEPDESAEVLLAQEEQASAVATEILRSLRAILHAVTIHSKKLARESGLTLPQVACLRALSGFPGESETVVGISRALKASPPTVTGIVDRLVRQGLVDKQRSTVDRRKVLVRMTELGRERLRSLPEQPQERFISGVMSLDPLSRTVLRESLQRILELMKAHEFDAAPILAAEESLDEPASE